MSERITDERLAELITEIELVRAWRRTTLNVDVPAPVDDDTLIALRELASLRAQIAALQRDNATMRARLLDQAREFMREQRTTFQLSDDTYHRDLGLLADFVQARIEAASCSNFVFNCECGDCNDRRHLQLEHDVQKMRARQVDRMRAKLLELAGECAQCGGSGETTIRGMCGGVEMDCDNQPCPDCKDIRDAARSAERTEG